MEPQALPSRSSRPSGGIRVVHDTFKVIWQWRCEPGDLEEREGKCPKHREVFKVAGGVQGCKDGSQQRAGPGPMKHGGCSRSTGSGVGTRVEGPGPEQASVGLCSGGPLLCYPGWEVAQPSYPSPRAFHLKPCKGIWGVPELCHLLLWATAQRWSWVAIQSPRLGLWPCGNCDF